MSLKKIVNLFFALIFINVTIKAQSNLLNASIPGKIGIKTAEQVIADHDKPLPYGFIPMIWLRNITRFIKQ